MTSYDRLQEQVPHPKSKGLERIGSMGKATGWAKGQSQRSAGIRRVHKGNWRTNG